MGTAGTLGISGLLAILIAFASGACGRATDRAPQNGAEPVKWYRRVAEQGDAGAQFNLGLCYANGDGVLQSSSAAVDWRYKAGQAYLCQGKRDDALRCYDRIVEVAPGHVLAKRLHAQIQGEEQGKGP